MYNHRSRGFTLIELLVVIAIIGILSAVILASLSTARTKGQDAAIQSDLNTVQTEAEIYYNGAGANSYGATTAVCTGGLFAADNTIANAIKGIQSNGSGSISCDSEGTSYAIIAELKSNTAQYFCVDSTGFATTTLYTALNNHLCHT